MRLMGVIPDVCALAEATCTWLMKLLACEETAHVGLHHWLRGLALGAENVSCYVQCAPQTGCIPHSAVIVQKRPLFIDCLVACC